MSEVVYQWHPDVVADFRELPEDLRAAYLEQIDAIRADPKLGEHLDRRVSTGDLSAYRKVRFGHDTPRGLTPDRLPVPTRQLHPLTVPGHRRTFTSRGLQHRCPAARDVAGHLKWDPDVRYPPVRKP